MGAGPTSTGGPSWTRWSWTMRRRTWSTRRCLTTWARPSCRPGRQRASHRKIWLRLVFFFQKDLATVGIFLVFKIWLWLVFFLQKDLATVGVFLQKDLATVGVFFFRKIWLRLVFFYLQKDLATVRVFLVFTTFLAIVK